MGPGGYRQVGPLSVYIGYCKHLERLASESTVRATTLTQRMGAAVQGKEVVGELEGR